jgi:hypothetical protein
MTMAMDLISRTVGARFLSRLAATARGRAFMLKFLLGAEQADEAGVFDHLVARVEDAELNRLVRKHRDDETRHATLFAGRLEGLGVTDLPEPVPVIPFIDRELGGFQASFVADRHGVMEAYLLLQVIEERGAAHYPLFADAIEPHDPATAALIRDVARDEVLHVKYAAAISRRYAPSEQILAQQLARMRTAEARAYRAHGDAFLVQAVDAGLVTGLLWRLLALVSRRQLPPPALVTAG